MNILITGAYGFIGQSLFSLLREGNELYRPRKGQSHAENMFMAYGQWYEKPDVIYHLAAYSRVQGSNTPENNVFENNVVSLKESLELARWTGAKLVFTSTSYCTVDPTSNYYALSKSMGEQLCSFYARTYSMNVAVIRLFNVYGNEISDYPEWKLGVVDRFLKDKRLGRQHVINNGGEQLRDYIHVDDVCEALATLGTQETDPTVIYEAGTGKLTSVNQIAKSIFGNNKAEAGTADGEIFRSELYYNSTPKEYVTGLELMKRLGWSPKQELESYIESKG